MSLKSLVFSLFDFSIRVSLSLVPLFLSRTDVELEYSRSLSCLFFRGCSQSSNRGGMGA